MKILIVTSYNNGRIAPFIAEQVSALRRRGMTCHYLLVRGHGPIGYLRNLPRLRRIVAQWQPDIVHAHYGLCGLLATLQRQVPVVITFHGSDLTTTTPRWLSRIGCHRAVHSIFVARHLAALCHADPTRYTLLPCGVDTERFAPSDRDMCRNKLGLSPSKHYILFAGSFDDKVKNAPLAQQAVTSFGDTELLELTGRSRDEVALLLNAVDLLLVTSYNEGSPQVVKEALACNCPVVSVDVGDVSEQLHDVANCHIVTADTNALAAACRPLLDRPVRSDGRHYLLQRCLTIDSIATQLTTIYRQYAANS